MEKIIVVDNRERLSEYASTIEKFFVLYVESFPDSDEREDPRIIIRRIHDGNFKPYSPSTAIILAVDGTNVYGGAIVEYYRESQCMLLTYIVIDPALRGKGIARKIMYDGIPKVIKAKGEPVKAVFFESNIPWKTKDDSFDPWQRYQAFSKLGAKWIDIAYTQPPLGKGKDRVYNLNFFIFPSFSGIGNQLQKDILVSFLDIFYRELGVEDPCADSDFRTMLQSIEASSPDEYIPLKEMPKQEQNIFSFQNVSVAYHFSEQITDSEEKQLPDEMASCPIFGSYEFDLFQFRFQSKSGRPYRTICKTEAPVKIITVRFPEKTQFITEGRFETLINCQPELQLEVKLNCTRFKNGSRIWTFVFNPVFGQSFTQTEIIKLINLFNRSQECSNIESSTVFFDGQHEFDSLGSLAENMAGVDSKHRFSLMYSGVVQVDAPGDFANPGTYSEVWKEVIADIDKVAKNDFEAKSGLEKRYLKEKEVRDSLNIMCGFALGIFDYNRMSYEEVLDTIMPLTSSMHTIVLMNKGILASFSMDDQMFGIVRNNIGMNPYLLISSTVLAYNEIESSNSENQLDGLLDSKKSSGGLRDLISKRKYLERKINEEILPNVFHYPTERIIFEKGMSHRGISDRIESVRNRIEELVALIDDAIASRKANSDIIVSVLLAAISILSLEKVFGDISRSIVECGGFVAAWKVYGLQWLAFLIFFIIAMFLTATFVIRSKKRIE